MQLHIVLVSFFLCAAAHAPPASLARISLAASAPDARSLDGTPTHFYFDASPRHRGEHGARTWVIWMEGGEDCTDESYCKQIIASGGGTSKNAPADWNATAYYPLLLPETTVNPLFWDANRVYVPYLTGDFHAGTRCKEPWLGKYHFCGHLHLEAMIDVLLQDYGLLQASLVVLTGCSTGGMSVFRNLDWLAEKLKAPAPKAQVIGVALSGFYFFQHPFTGPGAQPVQDFSAEGFKKYYDLHAAFVDQSCKDALSKQGLAWTCQQANYSSPYIHTPVFVGEDQTDMVVLTNHAGVAYDPRDWGAQMKEFVGKWQYNMTQGLAAFLEHPYRGVFSPACFHHCEFKAEGPSVKGFGIVSAVNTWVASVTHGRDPSLQISDDCGIMCNPTCSSNLVV